MKAKSKNKHSKIWWKWYVRGALTWVLIIAFLCYLMMFHMESSLTAPAKKEFIDVLLKCGVIATVLGLFLYFFILQNYYFAIDQLVQLFAMEEGLSDIPESDPYEASTELNRIIRSVNQLMDSNSSYKDQLNHQKQMLLENFLARLMRGQLRSEMLIKQSLKEFALDINSRDFLIMLFSMEQQDSPMEDAALSTVYAYLRSILKDFIQEAFTGYITEVDGMMACLIMSATEEPLDSINSEIEIGRIAKLSREIIYQKFQCTTRGCVSRVSRGILGCENAFSESQELLQYARLVGDDRAVLFYSDIKETKLYSDADYQWFKLERKFTNCINAENYQSAAQVFEELMDSEYVSNAPSLPLASCRLFGLLNAMINALGEVRLTMDADFFAKLDPQRRLLNCTTFPELRETSREIFQKINSYSQVQNESVSYNKMMGVVDYLKEHYDNPNLSIVSVADYFNTNASYLSRIFKKTMGIGISDYLQRLRIKQAILLLHESNMTIAEIASKVGYNNTLTMSRAFKKFEGTTPGKHRMQDRTDEEESDEE